MYVATFIAILCFGNVKSFVLVKEKLYWLDMYKSLINVMGCHPNNLHNHPYKAHLLTNAILATLLKLKSYEDQSKYQGIRDKYL